jgi:predicted N-acetyltransferase YhbS
VDRAQQGKGLGKALLFDALTRIEQAADIAGVRAVMVHAIDETARRFYEHLEFEPSPVDPFQMLLLMKDLRRAIRAGWRVAPARITFHLKGCRVSSAH